jgi:predicted Zn-dependent protease
MSFRILPAGRKRPLALSVFSDDDNEQAEDKPVELQPQQGAENTDDSRADQRQAAAVLASAAQSQQTPVAPPTSAKPASGGQSYSDSGGSAGSLQSAQQLLLQGTAHADAQRWSDALAAWDAAAVLDPDNAALHEMRAQVLLEVGQVWDAVQAATSATQLRPGWAPGWATLGRAQLGLGEVVLGLASLEAAARLDPADSDLAAELVGVRVLAGRQQAAGLGGTRLAVL